MTIKSHSFIIFLFILAKPTEKPAPTQLASTTPKAQQPTSAKTWAEIAGGSGSRPSSPTPKPGNFFFNLKPFK